MQKNNKLRCCQICDGSKNGSHDPPGSSRLFYAVEVFCENMEQVDLLPHIQPLLHHVLAILQVRQAVSCR